MEIENYEALKMDFQNLMSCIHCHEDSERNEVVLETLKTIVDICSHESCGRDAFREEGGLDFLVEFLFMTDNTTFLEHTLKTLAYVIDENVHSQMFMSKRSIFEIIQTILKKPTFPQEVWKNALLLISTILYNNSTAQSLALEIGLIQDLLNMYENCVQAVLLRSSIIISPSNGFTVDLWLRTNSALCFAVNNPQNEKNQEMCMNIFPVSLKIMEYSPSTVILISISSFLSLTISNNDKCQDYFSSCDGFLVLKRCLQKFFDAVFMDLKLCNVIGRENLQAIGSLIAIISAASLNHEKNATLSGKLGILSMMIKLIFVENLDGQLKTKIVLCLGHCIDAFSDNKSYVLETENFDTFLKKSFSVDDAELSSACKYLLHVCLINKGFSEADGNFAEYFNFAPTGSMKEICIPESNFVSFDGSTVLNKAATQTCPLKKNSTAGSIKQTPMHKAKNDIVKSFERESLNASSSSGSNSQPLYSKRKSLHSKTSLNELCVKKEHLSSPNTDLNEFLSNQKESLKCDMHLNYTYSNVDDGIVICNIKKDNNTSNSGQTLNKQNTISANIPFTDFLSKETKCNSTELQNQSIQQDQFNFSQVPSDNLTPQYNSFEKENKETVRQLGNPLKYDKFSAGREIRGNSQSKLKFLKETSVRKGYPRLLKMKKNKMYSKRAKSETSSSSSEYSFCPQLFENSEEKENVKYGYSILSKSAAYSPEVANCSNILKRVNRSFQKENNEWNLNMSKRPDEKPLFSSAANFQSNENYESKFILNLPSSKSENSSVKIDLYPKCNEVFSSRNSDVPIMKNVNTSTGSTNVSPRPADLRANRFSFSRHVSRSSGNSICLKNVDGCCHSREETIIPRALNVLENNSNKRKRSWDQSSVSIFSEGEHNLRSNKHMEVIVLPEGTCEEHGLSSTVELLEVVSLDEFNKHSLYL
ncbi:telomere repeats-binding bouquet formation protein 1 [Trichonephila inaurata madagascariensis]|uniref:Telomere repeats-binding bouquet formation protein 1 n=1 Tax=Trichonephila inaurata madagascariensis TaxID=2747483 RepID=A0A8X6Y1J2_9ARAC|nr:telomere repeats-binding bouquet formation protein 1 [Trichonephila inaurata madagascariensis]